MKKNNGKKFLSDIKLHSDYLKWREDLGRYETWEEACEDIVDGHRKKYSGIDIEEELASALESMKEMKVFASQRNLQFRYPQVKRSNLRLYNCSVTHAVSNEIFQNICYLLINGCGVGVSLMKPFVDNISNIKDRENGTKTFVIEDSIEGWADAFGVLMSSYFVDKQTFPEYANCKIRFDYSLIRPNGSLISGGFKAPGPDPLKKSLEVIEKFLDNLIDQKVYKLRPIHVFDIICHISDCILSGGVRRSALNMIIDPNDTEMIYAKIGNWRQTNPQRARSNNSVLLLRNIVEKKQFEEIVKLNDGDNDIGFAFANSWFDMFNPCVSSDSLINTPYGLYFPEDLKNNNKIILDSINFDSSGFRQTGVKKLLQIETEYGRKIKVTHEHIMFTDEGLVPACKLAIADKVIISNNTKLNIEFDYNSDSFKKGYLVGSFLADGNFIEESCQIKFWGKDNHKYHNKCIKYIKDLNWNIGKPHKELEEDSEVYSRLSSGGLYKFIKEKDESIISNKRLSKKLLSGDFNYINGLIAGYFDADGTVAFNQKKGNSIRITSVQLENLENLQIALNAIGIYSKIYKDRNKCLNGFNTLPDGKGGSKIYPIQNSYELCITKEAIDKFTIINILNEDKKHIINKILNNYSKKFYKQSFEERIVSICELDGLDNVYDCAVQFGIEAFECNGFKVHNCYEISFTPILTDKDLTQITYEELPNFIKENKDMFGVQLCNLTSMNAEKIKNKEDFLRACRDEAVLGTLQAGYTSFSYFKNKTEELTKKEALLGVSITGWMNNPKLFNKEWLQEGVKVILETNEKLAAKLGINKAARTTCVKPEGNLSVIAQTSSGIHPEHSETYFRIMQLNKNTDIAKWLNENMPFLLEESVWSTNNTDYVVFVPIINPTGAMFKNSMHGVKHLEFIKLVQENWILPGTRKELGISPKINHNCSCFSASEKIYTDQGLKSFEEISKLDSINVLNGIGNFSKSKVIHGGEQEIYEIILRKGSQYKTIKTTDNHKWLVVKNWDRRNSPNIKIRNTIDLEPGMKIKNVDFNIFPDFNLDAFLHGCVFGDGTLHKKNNKCQIYLFDDKCLAEYFELAGYKTIEKEDHIRIYGLPNDWKEFPKNKYESYIRSFISGWFATDGHISIDGRTMSLASANKENLEWLQKNSFLGKVFVNNISTHKRGKGSYPSKNTHFYTISINKDSIDIDFMKHDKKKDRFSNYLKNKSQNSKKWIVESVKSTEIYENVFCVEEPETNSFVMENNVLTHNCTIIIDDKPQIIDYIWENKDDFTAVSFISDYGDKDFNQAPFTSILNAEEIFQKYGKGSIFISGLIVDGLHYFNNNLWDACDCIVDPDIPISGTREQVMLKKYWVGRAKKFAKNYFKNDLKTLVYCLKDIHLYHKWESINREMREIDFSKALKAPEYKDISNYTAQACSAGACEIVKI